MPRRGAPVPGWPVFAGWILVRRLHLLGREPPSRFHLARREVLVERLASDPLVLRAVEAYAREGGIPEAAAARLARGYAREISPAFHAALYFRVGTPLAGWLCRALYRISLVGHEGLAALDEDASVVLVANHRSNMDYIILAHLVADRAAVSFAAGEWARVWPLGPLVRAMGAFFVRRGSGDPLYRRVLERFVQTAVAEGLTMGVFPEGGLSRDGRPGEPKIGLLDYMLRRFDPTSGPDLIFVPVAVNYDWVLEDRSLVETEVSRSSGVSLILTTVAHMVSNLLVALRGRRRLGSAAIHFGPAVSVCGYVAARGMDFRALDREKRIEEVGLLARRLMQAIAENVPLVSVALVARVLLEAPNGVLASEVAARARDLLADAERRRHRSTAEFLDVEDALQVLVLRRLVSVEGSTCRLTPRGATILRYYANSISHLLEPEMP